VSNIPQTPEAPAATVGQALGRAFKQPAFVIVVVLLLAAALGLNAAVSFMQLHFKKEPVPLAHPLTVIPDRFGSWVQVSQDKALDKELQDVLGTDQYIFREYVDEKVVGPGVVDGFKDKNDDDRRKKLSAIRLKYPTAVVNLSVTYYTGMVDTVAHVPDRCVTADGYEPKTYEQPEWAIARDLPASVKKKGDKIQVRYINFEDQAPTTGVASLTRSICYFFNTNGEYVCSPLEVRSKLANLMERKGYYAKIECMTTIENSSESARVLSDFLLNALPEIHKCMPDWQKEHAGGKTQVAAR
jgi:hypothetical protein